MKPVNDPASHFNNDGDKSTMFKAADHSASISKYQFLNSMNTVNLAKALKLKNSLVGEINRLKEVLTRENSRSELSTSTVDRQKVYEEIVTKTIELVSLKANLAKANVGIYGAIAEIAESKSLITYLKTLNTTDGIQRSSPRFDGNFVDTKFTAFLTQEKIDAEVAKVQKRIEELQDVVDAYNATATIQA